MIVHYPACCFANVFTGTMHIGVYFRELQLCSVHFQELHLGTTTIWINLLEPQQWVHCQEPPLWVTSRNHNYGLLPGTTTMGYFQEPQQCVHFQEPQQ